MPGASARHAIVEELVEKILDYSLNDSNSKMDWDFLVLWQSGDTTWIPYVEARPLEAFDDYVKDHPGVGDQASELSAECFKLKPGLTSRRGLW